MADTYTANGKVRKIAQNAYPDAWAAPLNDDAIELLDDMIAGSTAKNLGVSTAYTLAALSDGADSETRAMILKFTGTPASAVTITVPASVTSKIWLVVNSTTGPGQSLTIKYSGGGSIGVTIAAGGSAMVRADGSEVFLAATVTNDSVAATMNSMKRTQIEIDVGAVPDDASWPAGYFKRFGLDGGGVADDTTARDVMLAVGGGGQALEFGSFTTFLMSPVVMKTANNNVPPAIHGNNVTFKAKSGSSGVLVTLENPHTDFPGFFWDGQFTFDADAICATAFLLHGCQRARFGGMRFINSTNKQCRVEAESGFGVYHNIFQHWVAGGLVALGGGADGFYVSGVDDTNRVASNTWISPKSAYNVGHGYYLNHCSDVFVGLHGERNDGNAVNINFTTSVTFLGGYSEHNNENMSGGGATDSTPDISFALNSDCNHVMIFGGNHIGDITGDSLGSGHTLLPGRGSGVSLSRKGAGFNNVAPVDNGLNFAATVDFILRMTGTTKFRWVQASDMLQSHVKHLMSGELEIDGALNHDGTTAGFYGTTPIAKPTGVAVSAAGVHAALVSLGLIAA